MRGTPLIVCVCVLRDSTVASVSGNATVIKTHHNDTALVRQLRDAGRIIEPLRDYHKVCCWSQTLPSALSVLSLYASICPSLPPPSLFSLSRFLLTSLNIALG